MLMLTHVLFRRTKKSAEEMADRLRRQGYRVSVELSAYCREGWLVKAWKGKNEDQEAV